MFIHSFHPFSHSLLCGNAPKAFICWYLCIIWVHGNRCTVSSLCCLLKCFHYKILCEPWEKIFRFIEQLKEICADSTGWVESADRRQIWPEGLGLVLNKRWCLSVPAGKHSDKPFQTVRKRLEQDNDPQQDQFYPGPGLYPAGPLPFNTYFKFSGFTDRSMVVPWNLQCHPLWLRAEVPPYYWGISKQESF